MINKLAMYLLVIAINAETELGYQFFYRLWKILRWIFPQGKEPGPMFWGIITGITAALSILSLLLVLRSWL